MTLSFNGVTLDANDDWHDHSIISLSSPGPAGTRRTIVVSRGPMRGATLGDYARSESKELRRSTKRYVLHTDTEVEVGGEPGFLLEHSFQSENVRVRQLQVFIQRGALVYALAATTEESVFGPQREELLRIAQSLQVP